MNTFNERMRNLMSKRGSDAVNIWEEDRRNNAGKFDQSEYDRAVKEATHFRSKYTVEKFLVPVINGVTIGLTRKFTFTREKATVMFYISKENMELVQVMMTEDVSVEAETVDEDKKITVFEKATVESLYVDSLIAEDVAFVVVVLEPAPYKQA